MIVLTKDNIHKGGLVNEYDKNQRCLLGWIQFIKYVNPGPTYNKLILCNKLEAVIEDIVAKHYGADDYIGFNDDKTISKSQIAAVWNAAVESLGYDVKAVLGKKRRPTHKAKTNRG